MSPEERQMLTGLFDRIQAASPAPRDRDAEAFIADAVHALPFAPYVMAQTVLVQQEALRAANERVQQLEAQARDAQQQPQEATSFLGGLGKSIFGSASPAPAAASGAWGRQPAQQQQPPAAPWGGQQPPQGGPWGQGGAAQYGAPQAGGGFLKGALGAAAGVAGGVLLADSIRGMMGGHNSPFGGGIGGFGGGESVVNNYYGADSAGGALHQQDVAQDAAQDRADDLRDQDYAQDAQQDAGDYNNAGYDDNSGGGDDGSTDV